LLFHLDLTSNVDTVNLFSKGDTVIWPDGSNEQGFLSYKHCPALWSLGARPYISKECATELIEDIITCANMISSANVEPQENNIYIDAYYELVSYIKHLFIQYNDEVKDEKLLSEAVIKWGWFDLIKRAYDMDDYDRIIIITYNYDVFLERILRLHHLNFSIKGLDNDDNKIIILKPHGSISFTHETKNEKETFKIRKAKDMYEASLSNFNLKYTELNENYLINALIPPAGDSSRMTYKWANEMRTLVNQELEVIGENDKVIISGLSYWHVDRREIDELLIKLSVKNINTYMVNPNPPRALNAVLTCVLPKHITYTSSNLLKGVL